VVTISDKIALFYSKEGTFRDGIQLLRALALKTELQESFKWGAPVYTINNKNVLGIMSFKSYFGIWFFNGVFLKDPNNVLENAQEGKTKSMRHWKFNSIDEIDQKLVRAYILEAIENQKKGLQLAPVRSKKTIIPPILKEALKKDPIMDRLFKQYTPYKQREFCEYIAEAKQEKTKLSRLEKILPMIKKSIGLHDKYKNC
jgi:uncharacterized protein YdeI (YjbR/CyaY-like superfamily)